jgi:hypothetical protein
MFRDFATKAQRHEEGDFEFPNSHFAIFKFWAFVVRNLKSKERMRAWQRR